MPNTEATIMVEHFGIDSVEGSALALVGWLTKESGVKVWVEVKDVETDEVIRVLVDVGTLSVVEVKRPDQPKPDVDDERDHAETEPGQPGHVPMDAWEAGEPMTVEGVVSDMLGRDDASADDIADAAVETYRRVNLRATMVREAAGLLDVDERNPGEYRRGMVELICRTLGLVTDEHRHEIEAEIDAEIESQNAGLLSERAARRARGDFHYQGVES